MTTFRQAVPWFGPVVEQVMLERPFCRLLCFVPDPLLLGGFANVAQTAVLVCAPLAGHHAVLLRQFVPALLPDHDVYVTDWNDARRVPVAEGPFHPDDYVTEVRTFVLDIGVEQLHVLALCQATVPALAAVSLLANAEGTDPQKPDPDGRPDRRPP
ncbi:MAG: hypothetical protein ACREYA_33435 [Cupriavidus necator]